MLFRSALRILLCCIASLATADAAASSSAHNPRDPWGLCAAHVAQAERILRLPSKLMQAISKVESGRWNRERKALFAWPWTVMAEGQGRYLPNRRAAIAEVRRLQARGVRNIDVGCMQVNLYWHPEAFESLEQAFDPVYNVAYAAAFLQELRREARTWPEAVGRYHSSTPPRMRAYRDKVLDRWHEEKRAARKQRLAARSQAALPAGDGEEAPGG